MLMIISCNWIRVLILLVRIGAFVHFYFVFCRRMQFSFMEARHDPWFFMMSLQWLMAASPCEPGFSCAVWLCIMESISRRWSAVCAVLGLLYCSMLSSTSRHPIFLFESRCIVHLHALIRRNYVFYCFLLFTFWKFCYGYLVWRIL